MPDTPRAPIADDAQIDRPITLVIESVDRQELHEIAADCRFVLVGRAPDCDLQIDHPDVSRRHALLVRWQNALYCIDLASRTGTRIGPAGPMFGWVTPVSAASIGPVRFWQTAAHVGSRSRSDVPPEALLHATVRDAEIEGFPRLKFLTPGINPATYQLKRPLTLVGRSPRCKIQLRLPTISWVHAAILATADGVYVRDLSTRGGLTVDGAVMQTGCLAPGAELGLADVRIRLERAQPAPPTWETETDDTLGMHTELWKPPRSAGQLSRDLLPAGTGSEREEADRKVSAPAEETHDAPPPNQFPLGRQIGGRYRLIAPLARGGMGVVFKGHDVLLHRPVAVKLVRNPGRKGEAARQRLLREATLCAQLDHPHIVHVIDVDRHGRFAVFEFVEGESLGRHVHGSGTIVLADALRWTAEIADALAYMSARGVVHRDVKPANVLLTSSRSARLIDFGLARQQSHSPGGKSRTLDAAQCLIRRGVAVGSVMYISPEQLLDSAAADARSDIYSLGCTLYTLLAGHPPFSGESTDAVIHQHFDADPLPIPSVDSAVMTVIERALQKEPQDRYQDAGELAADLRLLLGAHAAAAENKLSG